jgi:L-aminopeptidase/D-esterase-like protein
MSPRSVPFDLPAVRVGVSEDPRGPTGCTVLVLDRPAALAVDVRGGIPAVHRPEARFVEAICLAGGSVLGLEVATGVAADLYATRGSDPARLPAVTGGVIYDFAPPGRSGVHPDATLGRSALRAATAGSVPVGPVGAARSATCGKLGRAGWAEPGGQGAAHGTAGSARILVVVVVNALGVVVDRAGRVVRGNRDPETGVRAPMTVHDMAFGHQRQLDRFGPLVPTATTLTVVVTDARLDRGDLNQLSRQVHASLARAIHPFHCSGDGDALWFATTNEQEAGVSPTAIGTVASELAWDAVLDAVSEEEDDGARLRR